MVVHLERQVILYAKERFKNVANAKPVAISVEKVEHCTVRPAKARLHFVLAAAAGNAAGAIELRRECDLDAHYSCRPSQTSHRILEGLSTRASTLPMPHSSLARSSARA